MAHVDELDRYPSPHIAVDVVVLTCTNRGLEVLLTPGPGGESRALPGRFLRPKKRLRDGVVDVLSEKTGIDVDPRTATWLGLFDDPRRDPRGWTMSAAYLLGIPPEVAGRSRFGLETVEGGRAGGGPLLYDHDEILGAAVEVLRGEYESQPDPRGFLTRPFTLTELREVHEAVLGERLLRDTFRRRMEPMLRTVEGTAMPSGVGRPAQVYVAERLSSSHKQLNCLPRVTK